MGMVADQYAYPNPTSDYELEHSANTIEHMTRTPWR